jgi:hypothetical protein
VKRDGYGACIEFWEGAGLRAHVVETSRHC